MGRGILDVPNEVLMNITSYLGISDILRLSYAIRHPGLDFMLFYGGVATADYENFAVAYHYDERFRCRKTPDSKSTTKNWVQVGSSTAHKRLTAPKTILFMLRSTDNEIPMDLSESSLMVDAAEVYVQSYVRKLILHSIPYKLEARFSILKIHMRSNARYDVFARTPTLMHCKKIILVFGKGEWTSANQMAADQILTIARFLKPVPVEMMFLMSEESEYLQTAMVQKIARDYGPLVSKLRFKCNYDYNDIGQYSQLMPVVNIRRRPEEYELVMSRSRQPYRPSMMKQ